MDVLPFPSPTDPEPDERQVLLRYLDYFRSVVVSKVGGMPEGDRAAGRLASGWTPLELLNHLRHVERRWLEWGFEGADVPDPWADRRGDRWHTDAGFDELAAALSAQAATTRRIAESHDLDDVGQPGERWDGAPPAPLRRVLLHLVQEYARHTGHVDVVRELADGTVGEGG